MSAELAKLDRRIAKAEAAVKALKNARRLLRMHIAAKKAWSDPEARAKRIEAMHAAAAAHPERTVRAKRFTPTMRDPLESMLFGQ